MSEDIACRFATVTFGSLAQNVSDGPIKIPSAKSLAAVPPSKHITIPSVVLVFCMNRNFTLSAVLTAVGAVSWSTAV